MDLMTKISERFPVDCEPQWQATAPLLLWMTVMFGVFLYVNSDDEKHAKAYTLKMAKWTRAAIEVGIMPMAIDFKADILAALNQLSMKLNFQGDLTESNFA